MITDSGNRTSFSTGAVRDIQDDKGRCDLMPIGVIADMINSDVLKRINEFIETSDPIYLHAALRHFCREQKIDFITMLLEVSIHFRDGAIKYGCRNWQKGIPISSYLSSGIRHYLKVYRRDNDERHDRAFAWNILCCLWTLENKPELNDIKGLYQDEEEQ